MLPRVFGHAGQGGHLCSATEIQGWHLLRHLLRHPVAAAGTSRSRYPYPIKRQAGSANFFIEPYGEVYPCNGLEERYWKESMGNIRDVARFDELWNSEQAQKVRGLVRTCPKNCWMVGTAAPVMKKYIKHPTAWVVKNKIKSMLGKPICIDDVPYYDVGQDPRQGDLREMPTAKAHDIKRHEVAVLSEEELADMLRTD